MTVNRQTMAEDETARADELAENTVLSPREAEVWALKERGLTHAEIADELELAENTVDEFARRVRRKRDRARTTLDEIDPDIGTDD